MSTFQSTCNPKSFSIGLLWTPHPVLVPGVPWPRCSTSTQPCSTLQSSMGHSSSLARCLWLASPPSGWSAVPLSLGHLQMSISLMKMLNVLVPTWTPEGHLLSLMSTGTWSHWPLPTGCNHPTIPLNLSSPYLSTLERRMWRIASKALEKSR